MMFLPTAWNPAASLGRRGLPFLSRGKSFHDVLTDSLEPSSVLRQEGTSLLVTGEIGRQQTSDPVLEGPEEDLLGHLGNDLLFLTLRGGLRSLLFFNLRF